MDVIYMELKYNYMQIGGLSDIKINNGVVIQWIYTTIDSVYHTVTAKIITLPINCNILLGIADSYSIVTTAWQQTGFLISPIDETSFYLRSYQDPSGGNNNSLSTIILIIGN